jgi:hypothetical protein
MDSLVADGWTIYPIMTVATKSMEIPSHGTAAFEATAKKWRGAKPFCRGLRTGKEDEPGLAASFAEVNT